MKTDELNAGELKADGVSASTASPSNGRAAEPRAPDAKRGDADLMQDPRTPEILDIVAKETGVARGQLLPDARIEALGIASLDMVQTIFAIETRYDVEIPVVPDRVGAEFDTVGGLLAHVIRTLDRAQPERG